MASTDIKTVGGCVLKPARSMGKITLTDESGGVANVTINHDVKQSNGVASTSSTRFCCRRCNR